MKTITRSVGNDGGNLLSDVRTVQTLLNRSIHYLVPLMLLEEDGDPGPLTVGMIVEFQHRVMGFKKPDGLVEPKGKTFARLLETAVAGRGREAAAKAGLYDPLMLPVQIAMKNFALTGKTAISQPKAAATPVSRKLSEADFLRAATELGVEVAAVKAVSAVESAGSGFLDGGRPKILFEGHWFSKFTKHKYDTSHPTLSYKKWTKQHYQGGALEYGRLDVAKTLDKEAALKSTSWGKFQIMGFNHKLAGYATVTAFVDDMKKSEGAQLLAFVKFIKSTKLDTALKAKDWAAFAKGYNGSAYAKNQYDIRLKQAYNAFSAKK